MEYIWKNPGWPAFTYQTDALQDVLYKYAAAANALAGRLAGLNEDEKSEALIDLMVTEAIRTSQIEGEHYDRDDVRSSIRNQLGLVSVPEPVRDPRANGIAALMIAARDVFHEPITATRLFHWHDLVMTNAALRARIPVGQWRDDEMQIVSGPMGREMVHFIAPPPDRVPHEMADFINWFNETAPEGGKVKLPAPVRAAVLHLYFETIHPFADGNGRIGRALSEVALSQELGSPVLLSLSSVIQKRRSEYYDELNLASRGGIDITRWVVWFVTLVLQAQMDAREMIMFVLAKARFWDKYASQLNERQVRAIKRMMREGPDGFTGGMSPRKYVAITGCAKATATRDLAELAAMGIFQQRPGGGRSTSYELILPQAG